MATSEEKKPHLDVSPIPPNPLGEGNYVRTAAALVIGDEILNGKTQDKNAHVFAKFCFEHGIDLKRIEVIPDDEDEIIEASRRLVSKFDFVITSGGIGPTHDDITYASLAKAFIQPIEYHAETIRRMDLLTKPPKVPRTPEQTTAFRRMALLPAKAETLYVRGDFWVPVVRLEGKLCVLPGIPTLFEGLLNALVPYLPLPPPDQRLFRILVQTRKRESDIAPFLTDLQARVKSEGIRVGSYPKWGVGVHVSLIGSKERVETLAQEVAREIEGEVLPAEVAGDQPSKPGKL